MLRIGEEMKKIKIQSLYFQINYWEVEVPDHIPEEDKEDWAHDLVNKVTEEIEVKASPVSWETEGVKLLLEKKIDEETQPVEDEIWEKILKGE